MILLALVLVALWLGVVTLVLLVLIRQVTALQLALQQRAGESFSVDADGPVVGTTVDEAVMDVLRRTDLDTDGALNVLVLSSTCGPCREIVTAFEHERAPHEPIVALVAGSGLPSAELSGLAAQRFEAVVHGGPADEAAQALSIHSSPFLVLIHNSVVVAKTYVRSVEDIYDMTLSSAAAVTVELDVEGTVA